jgi:hypothetical protein
VMPSAWRYGIFSTSPAYVPRFSGATPELGCRVKHGDGGVVAASARRLSLVSVWHRDSHGIWIEKEFVAVESQSTFRLVRSIGAVCVHLTGPQAGHEDMPIVNRSCTCWDRA